MIEAKGSTSLVQVGGQLFPVPGRRIVGPGAELQRRARGGAESALDADRRGEDGERLRGCLEGRRGTDQYAVWNTDSSGNYLSSTIGVVSGTSAALQSSKPVSTRTSTATG